MANREGDLGEEEKVERSDNRGLLLVLHWRRGLKKEEGVEEEDLGLDAEREEENEKPVLHLSVGLDTVSGWSLGVDGLLLLPPPAEATAVFSRPSFTHDLGVGLEVGSSASDVAADDTSGGCSSSGSRGADVQTLNPRAFLALLHPLPISLPHTHTQKGRANCYYNYTIEDAPNLSFSSAFLSSLSRLFSCFSIPALSKPATKFLSPAIVDKKEEFWTERCA